MRPYGVKMSWCNCCPTKHLHGFKANRGWSEQQIKSKRAAKKRARLAAKHEINTQYRDMIDSFQLDNEELAAILHYDYEYDDYLDWKYEQAASTDWWDDEVIEGDWN